MLSPTFLSTTDRNRLAEINQLLLGAHTTEEGAGYRLEQQALMAKRRTIQECTVDELTDLRQQLFTQYQKHAGIGSRQTQMIHQYVQQVEHRLMMINLKRVEEPEMAEHDKPKSKVAVPADKSKYSWSIGTDDDDSF
jgi:hypothetical protein